MGVNIKFLSVGCGDCIFIEYGLYLENVIVVDTGFARTYTKTLKPELEKAIQAKKKLVALIITHIDDDHIGGINKMIPEGSLELFEEIWFNINDYEDYQELSEEGSIHYLSVQQGNQLKNYILSKGLSCRTIHSGMTIELYGAKFQILSPSIEGLKKLKENWNKKQSTPIHYLSSKQHDYQDSIKSLILKESKEDSEFANGSSIAFIFEYDSTTALLTGDAHPSTLVKSLSDLGFNDTKPIVADIVKVPHHGSKHNLNNQLAKLIKTQNYIISADSVNRHLLPHKEALSRILFYKPDSDSETNFFYTHDNNKIRGIFTVDEIEEYKLNQFFPENEQKYIVFERQ